MEHTIEMIYKKQPYTLKISSAGRTFDSSRIADMPLEQWVYPFCAGGIQWKGLYEELKQFAGSPDFTLRLDSDTASFALVQHALAGMPVQLAEANHTVTVVYSENPVTTKIVINGRVFDIALIQNRYIDEWIHPFQVRGIQWSGIFKEIERMTGTDAYTLYFVGEQRFMNLLIENCPEKISIFYRNAQMADQTANARRSTGTVPDAVPNAAPEPEPVIHTERISAAAGKAVEMIRQSADTADHTVSEDQIPIKNAFIRNNIVTLCAICALVFLVLPFAGFSATATTRDALSGSEVSMESNVSVVSGFETIFGIKAIKIGTNKSVFAILLLIMPILMIILNYIKQLKPYRKWIAVGAPALGIIAEIITVIDVGNIYKTFTVGASMGDVKNKISPGIGFFSILLVYLLMIATGLILYHGMRVPKKKKEM